MSNDRKLQDGLDRGLQRHDTISTPQLHVALQDATAPGVPLGSAMSWAWT